MKVCIIVNSKCDVDVSQRQKCEETNEEQTHDSAGVTVKGIFVFMYLAL